MPFALNTFRRSGIALLSTLALAGAARAADFSNAANYNTPFGMQSGQENAPVNASLRDANGNLQVVNGQFQTNAFGQGFAQAGSSASAFGSGAGTSGSGAAFGGATAIGNALNVITTGSNNTVVVNSIQTNKGNVTATTSVNGK